MSDRNVAAWLALFLFGVYLLSFSGQLYSQDSQSMFSVAESVVKRGSFDTDQMWTLFKARNEIASDGESYAKYGYGASLFAVPLYAVGLALTGIGLVQTTLLASAVVIALAGALVFLALRRLGFLRPVSVITALLFGLATPAWVYAKQFWSEPFALFTLLAAFYFLLCFRQERRARDAVLAGLALGLGVAVRTTNLALVPLFALYGFVDVTLSYAFLRAINLRWQPFGVTSRPHSSFAALSRPFALFHPFSRSFALFAFAFGLVALTIGWYDWVRYGNPFTTGYRPDETFNTPFILGAYGLLFSPGKGLFVYVPFLAALAFSVPVFLRRARAETLLVLVTCAFYLLTFSMWYYWWGGTNWGPRFLVPLLPFLVMLVAPAVELAVDKTRSAFTFVFGTLAILSFGFEVLGVAVPSLSYRLRMVSLSRNPDMDAIFLPQFSPLVGSIQQLRPRVLDFAWIRADAQTVSVDWLVVALTVGFILFCAAMLMAYLSPRPPSLKGKRVWGLGVLLALTLSVFSLYRYRGDARFGGSDGYAALLQTVAQNEQPRDVMILNNDIYTPYFLNENRARLRSYGLSRDPKQWDDATRALLGRLAQTHPRVWFAFDDSTGALPDPSGDWLAQSLRETARYDFDEGVHLILYASDAFP